MILSFSVPAMRPMIEAGLRQMRGETVDERVKRQTIRARGPRAEKLLSYDPICHSIGYDLQLWWKSRTARIRVLSPSYLQSCVKSTVRIGMFTPTPSVSVPQTILSRPDCASFSTASRYFGSMPAWCTPMP